MAKMFLWTTTETHPKIKGISGTVFENDNKFKQIDWELSPLEWFNFNLQKFNVEFFRS